MSLTASQQTAITAEGNVLVVAGAGTGKTHTLVERCLARVCAAENPVSLENVLLVTFTEAAAAEMRKRLREELERRAAAEPENLWLAGQLALVDTPLISTLHGFCLRLIREHFHELELDPQLVVLAEEQSHLLARETLDKLLQKHYAGATATAAAVQQLVRDHGRGWDQPVRTLILRLHNYTQTLRNPAGWFAEQLGHLHHAAPELWRKWLREGFGEWRKLWPAILRAQPAENTVAHQCVDVLESSLPMAETLARIVAFSGDVHWPRGTKGKFRDPIKGVFDEAEFLQGLLPTSEGDPLTEDWNWARPQMVALLQLTQEFSAKFGEAKRELAAVDFHDLEQFALQLLVDRASGQATEVAAQWRSRLRLLFVDEYQDINAAQDAILTALGGEGAAANRFLVGDVKQSIYRFRLADPAIFQRYKAAWEVGDVGSSSGKTVSLSDNFRSHETILNFVNALFAFLMRHEVGGVEYDAPQHLQFGAPKERRMLAASPDVAPRVELHLVLNGSENGNGAGEEIAELTGAEREAQLVAKRLLDLERGKFQIWDKNRKEFRPVAWGDMAILLRSPRNKAEAYAKVFAHLNIPLLVARGGFFESPEVMDLLNLLHTLDNPLQDLPLLAVLRSPLVGLSLEELATVRLVQMNVPFWTALAHFNPRTHPADNADLARKVAKFLERFHRWRQLARQAALSQCVEAALDETHYEAWLLAQPRGEQGRANVQRLLALTRQFDQFQRQGLFRFLRFIEAQLDAEADLEPAAAVGDNAVQLMSIHQSKGLDFPVVVVADVGKRFNFDDLKARVILDEQYGLCPKIKPPHTPRTYPSLPHWLAQRRQRRETLGEELRLLYVATTRARDLLILAGTTSAKSIERDWTGGACAPLSTADILAANNSLSWLGRSLSRIVGGVDWTRDGHANLLTWTVYEENDPRLKTTPATGTAIAQEGIRPAIGPQELARLREKLEWRYRFAPATVEPAKTSVSALRRRLREEHDEARPLFQAPEFKFPTRARIRSGKLSAAEIGTAHHMFLQLAQWHRLETLQDLHNEAERLRQGGVFTEAEVAALDFDALLAFWRSDLGRRIHALPEDHIHREIPFTARLTRADLRSVSLNQNKSLADDEFVVAQGYIDLAVIQPREIWLVDFKTDRLKGSEIEDKRKLYSSQLQLYALALARIYQRPVTECWLYFLAAQKAIRVENVEPARGSLVR